MNERRIPPDTHQPAGRLHHPAVSGILLAAGESRRMGKPKLLLPWGEATLIEHVVDAYLRSKLFELIVVVGAFKGDIKKVLAGKDVTIVENADYGRGMSSSLRCGVKEAANKADGCLIGLADQPFITTETINLVIQAYAEKMPLIAAAAHKGRRGHPLIFSKMLRRELCQVQGDQGGREILDRYRPETLLVEIQDIAIFEDIDTPDDYQRMTHLRR